MEEQKQEVFLQKNNESFMENDNFEQIYLYYFSSAITFEDISLNIQIICTNVNNMNEQQCFQKYFKRTKRNYSVYKCIIDSRYGEFRIRILNKPSQKENINKSFQHDEQILDFQNPFFKKENKSEVSYQSCQNEIKNKLDESIVNRKYIQRRQKKRLVIYKDTLIEVQERSEQSKGIILSTDLGGTLCGLSEASIEFTRIWIQYFYFDERSQLIYNSGRGLHSMLLLISKESLIQPDFYIGRCGSLILSKSKEKGQLEQDLFWKLILRDSWQPEKIKKIMENTQSWLFLKERKESEEECLSLSYICPIDSFKINELEFIAAQQTIKCQNILCNYILRQKKGIMHIEILPYITDKGIALEYIYNQITINRQYKFNHSNEQNINKTENFEEEKNTPRNSSNQEKCIEKLIEKAKLISSGQYKYPDILIHSDSQDIVVAFGDTMNDTGMLRVANHSIIVNNCETEMRQWVLTQEHPNIYISTYANAYALIDFLKKHI